MLHRSIFLTVAFEPLDSTEKMQNKKASALQILLTWSGWRGSNPLPPPWQGGALPDELHPHFIGASGRNRTTDTGIFSPLLYRLSYRGKNWRPGTGSNRRPLAWQASVLTNWTTGPYKKIGGRNRARTYDPLLVRQMLSQLSYATVFLSTRFSILCFCFSVNTFFNFFYFIIYFFIINFESPLFFSIFFIYIFLKF